MENLQTIKKRQAKVKECHLENVIWTLLYLLCIVPNFGVTSNEVDSVLIVLLLTQG